MKVRRREHPSDVAAGRRAPPRPGAFRAVGHPITAPVSGRVLSRPISPGHGPRSVPTCPRVLAGRAGHRGGDHRRGGRDRRPQARPGGASPDSLLAILYSSMKFNNSPPLWFTILSNAEAK